MTTPTFNLTLPIVTTHGRSLHYLSREQRAAYDAAVEARTKALVALLPAIAPELAQITPRIGNGYGPELFVYRLGAPESFPIALQVRALKNGQLELRIDAGYRDGRNTFRRFTVDPKGAVSERIVEGTRELVKLALEIARQNAAHEVRKADAATEKARAFAHSTAVVKAAGLSWGYEHNHEGRVDLNGYTQRAEIKGRMMTVELNGLDVDQLPAVLAFVRSLS